ncbi:hypothetical protein SAMN05421803_11485 [Nocardiopsis flavescens]|uniref:CRISPR/Cas system CSM-associated protein Csm3, group 7 of RAMP superfamily n=1 Tax=Nocardiopsis flavescens TaxID=758803 RepID=A0A1M6Q3C3_9ACTN|nr:hypothetical protein [Nocardiopsis flavescens]SHK14734.1 hypothetical protein SAMN05421803_11485 [Nocardiopsis flavescens]
MSAPDRVVVRLASPALFVGASADGTGADTDVVTDDHGLPYLPRHRLAARLRAGAQRSLAVSPGLEGAVGEVFGRGRSHGRDRMLRVGHAVAGDTVRTAVARALAGRSEPARAVLRRAVTDAYTVLETGIEVGAHGAAEPGRLRTHRVLLPGLVLTSALTWAQEPAPEHWRLLARACLATTGIGLKGTRGRGRVDVRLAAGPGEDPDALTLRLAAPPARVRT